MTKNNEIKKMVTINLPGLKLEVEKKADELFKIIGGEKMVETPEVKKADVLDIFVYTISEMVNSNTKIITIGYGAKKILSNMIDELKSELVEKGFNDNGRIANIDMEGVSFKDGDEMQTFAGQIEMLHCARIKSLELISYIVDNLHNAGRGNDYDKEVVSIKEINDEELKELQEQANKDKNKSLTACSILEGLNDDEALARLKKFGAPILKGFEDGIMEMANELNVFDKSSKEYKKMKKAFLANVKELLFSIIKSVTLKHSTMFNCDHEETTTAFFFLSATTQEKIRKVMPKKKPSNFGNISSLKEYKKLWNAKELKINGLHLSTLNCAFSVSTFDFLAVLFEGLDEDPFVFIEAMKALEIIISEDDGVDTKEVELAAAEILNEKVMNKKGHKLNESKLDKLKEVMEAAGKRIERDRDFGIDPETKLN